MKGLRRVGAILLMGGALLQACAQYAPPQQPPLITNRTTLALTPKPTETPIPTETPVPTETLVPTETPVPTAGPSPTPIPPTPARDIAADFGYCAATFGPASAQRFSARLDSIVALRTAGSDELDLSWTVDSGSLQGRVTCIQPQASSTLIATSGLSSVVRLELPQWRHDDLFATSVLTLTRSPGLGGLRNIRSVSVEPLSDRSAGAVLEIGLSEPLPFAVELDGRQLRLAIGDSATLAADPLGGEEGQPRPPVQPLIFNRQADLWRLEGGRAVPFTRTAELEGDLAVSPDRSQVAFCRAAADTPAEFGALWLSNIDGGNQRLLADVGGCADLAWSFDGAAVWFAAPWSAAQPISYRLWSVDVRSGEPQARSALDEWSRRQPQPLPRGGVIAVGQGEGGRSTLLLNNEGGETAADLGLALTGRGYSGVGAAILSSDGNAIAVEALRPDGGADLAVLDTKGAIQSLRTGGWWRRPLAWDKDGNLLYLATICQSGVVLSYELHSLAGSDDKTLLTGQTLDAIGTATATDEGLVFIRSRQSAGPPLRGPLATLTGASEIWLYDPASNGRLRLAKIVDAISAIR